VNLLVIGTISGAIKLVLSGTGFDAITRETTQRDASLQGLALDGTEDNLVNKKRGKTQ